MVRSAHGGKPYSLFIAYRQVVRQRLVSCLTYSTQPRSMRCTALPHRPCALSRFKHGCAHALTARLVPCMLLCVDDSGCLRREQVLGVRAPLRAPRCQRDAHGCAMRSMLHAAPWRCCARESHSTIAARPPAALRRQSVRGGRIAYSDGWLQRVLAVRALNYCKCCTPWRVGCFGFGSASLWSHLSLNAP